MSNQPNTEIQKRPISMLAQGRGVQLTSLSELSVFAQAAEQSGLAPKGMNAQAIMLAVELGAELGIPPMAAIQNIAVINGRPTIWGDMLLAICQSHPEFDFDSFDELIKGEGDLMVATCTAKRRNSKKLVTKTFSVADAKQANLWGKAGPWQQYPKRMLQMRARAFCLRDTYPDAIKGVYSREEVEEFEPMHVTATVRAERLADQHGVKPVEKPAAVTATTQPAQQVPVQTDAKRGPGRPRKTEPEIPPVQQTEYPPAPEVAAPIDEPPPPSDDDAEVAAMAAEFSEQPEPPAEGPVDPPEVVELVKFAAAKWGVPPLEAREFLNVRALRSTYKKSLPDLAPLQIKGMRSMVVTGGIAGPAKK